MKKRKKLNKKGKFLVAFAVAVLALIIIRNCVPSLSNDTAAHEERDTISAQQDKTDASQAPQNPAQDTPAAPQSAPTAMPDTLAQHLSASTAALYQGYSLHPDLTKAAFKAHPFAYFGDYGSAFPDINDVQLVFAQTHGIKPCKSPQEIVKQSGSDLVYIGASPYYHVEDLSHSAPYLVPRAQALLNCIGRNFMDSLFVKKLPQAQLIVTSVTRSTQDVAQLQTKNKNSTSNSCHFYGTTIDISYVRYHAITRPDGSKIRVVRDDTLKQVLGEVLRDLRQSGACYVKHERKQSCFHITVK